eukprot:CAMPEP_0172378630 /NCGR_PEP_ID=MMETSP1060-20121228/69519_1 /TAXON_ID=37318 /ORGANISM="Pseudo-nitzschia pungens, Strain cf. cingulata" /LENGTH=608 /DNA_ID=CAMNT_0013106353 /DNA_START=383 /DNA_END=2211 /DNA_ORIENTATION=+
MSTPELPRKTTTKTSFNPADDLFGGTLIDRVPVVVGATIAVAVAAEETDQANGNPTQTLNRNLSQNQNQTVAPISNNELAPGLDKHELQDEHEHESNSNFESELENSNNSNNNNNNNYDYDAKDNDDKDNDEKDSDNDDYDTSSEYLPTWRNALFVSVRYLGFCVLVFYPCLRGICLWHAAGGRILPRWSGGVDEDGRGRGFVTGLRLQPADLERWLTLSGFTEPAGPSGVFGFGGAYGSGGRNGSPALLTTEEVLELPEVVVGDATVDATGDATGDATIEMVTIAAGTDDPVDNYNGVSASQSESQSESTAVAAAPEAPPEPGDSGSDSQHPSTSSTSASASTTTRHHTSTLSTSCSICLEDYCAGETVRLLPRCGHSFHTECILPWLTERQPFCPYCKLAVKEIPSENNNDNRNGNGSNGNESSPSTTAATTTTITTTNEARAQGASTNSNNTDNDGTGNQSGSNSNYGRNSGNYSSSNYTNSYFYNSNYPNIYDATQGGDEQHQYQHQYQNRIQSNREGHGINNGINHGAAWHGTARQPNSALCHCKSPPPKKKKETVSFPSIAPHPMLAPHFFAAALLATYRASCWKHANLAPHREAMKCNAMQ